MVDGYCNQGGNVQFVTNTDHVVGHVVSALETMLDSGADP